MASSSGRLYVHLVWATRGRAPTLTPQVARIVRATVVSKAAEHRCRLVAIGGTSDHVHLLLRIGTTVTVAELAHGLKGASSHAVNSDLALEERFAWQGAYSATSVSPEAVERVEAYVRNQAAHHRAGDVRPDMEGVAMGLAGS